MVATVNTTATINCHFMILSDVSHSKRFIYDSP